MITVKLQGGLGNQMFQYAAGRSLSSRHNTAMKMDDSFLKDKTPRKEFVQRDYSLDIFNVYEEFAKPNEIVEFGKYRRLSRLLHAARAILDKNSQRYIRENPYGFDHRFFKYCSHAYVEGYWQSEEYFTGIAPAIRKEFTFKEPPGAGVLELARKISGENAVCVNVRRGDFVALSSANKHHGVVPVEYFYEAARVMLSRVGQMTMYVFSDDIEWCRQTLRFNSPTIFVEHGYAGKKFGDYLRLISLCKHQIIPNSSFGWWGAWLNANPNKTVIAPRKWYENQRMDTTNLLPPDWIRL